MAKALRIDGEVLSPLDLSVAELRTTYSPYSVQTSYIHDDDLSFTTFTGARLWDLVQSAQVKADPTSEPEMCVMARAKDNLSSIISWSEFDPAHSERLVLVAYEQDSQPLSDGVGPLRLVVPGDERGRRYLRELVQLTVLTRIPNEEEL